MGLWRKLETVEDPPIYLQEQDECYYARDYVARGGYQASEANNLIHNLKKPAERRGRPEWRYKTLAIKRFARELSEILPDGITVTSIPTSKRRGSKGYDPRLDCTLDILQKSRDIRVERPIEKKRTSGSLHGGAPRNIGRVYRSLVWCGFDTVPGIVVLIDDVITTGSTFKACQRLILVHHPGMRVIGVFWARTVWP